jgi:predicted amidohydrolase
MNIIWEDKEANKRKIEGIIQSIVTETLDLILFPEMCLTGFSMNIEKTKETKETSQATIQFFSDLAVKYGMSIGFGWTRAGENEKAENHYTIVNLSGEILADYIKIHPFHFAGEDQYFNGGKELIYCKIKDYTVSPFICYDLRFPEIFQAASKHADMIIVPANWPEQRREHWRCLLRARAIENQVYILGINCTGESGGVNYSGDSCIIDPSGEVIKEISDEEGILLFDFKNDVPKFRKAFPMKQDRKIDLYKKLYESVVRPWHKSKWCIV